MPATMLLDRDQWDWVLDANGNIAVATEPYSQVQDVASACRLFRGDAYYDATLGIPYFQQILGQFQPVQIVKTFLEQAAVSVPGVVTATAFLSQIAGRELQGQVQVETADGTVQVATL